MFDKSGGESTDKIFDYKWIIEGKMFVFLFIFPCTTWCSNVPIYGLLDSILKYMKNLYPCVCHERGEEVIVSGKFCSKSQTQMKPICHLQTSYYKLDCIYFFFFFLIHSFFPFFFSYFILFIELKRNVANKW